MSQSNNNFGTRVGAVLAAAGSAVGLGNVWRFPTETGANGGAAFILIYIVALVLVATPVIISELAIGRYGGKNVSHSFVQMSGGKKAWGVMGLLPVVAGILVLSYYAVVAGWTLEYLAKAAVNDFAGKAPTQYAADFADFSASPLRPVVYLAGILALTCGIVAFGVQRGIERASKVLMPVLFAALVGLAVCALMMPGAEVGLTFLLRPDFSKVTGATVLSALGQAFFTLSAGLCCLCTFGCYFRRDTDLVKSSFTVAGIDTLVALLSGLIIFPAVYSIPGLTPDAGPSLVFVTLPGVFQQVFSGAPVVAYAFSLAFYALLVLAALTSSISMLEMSVAIFIRKFGMGRIAACLALTTLCFVLGAACSLSFGPWAEMKIFGMTIFEFFDYLVAKFFMPLGGFIICIFAGWVAKNDTLRSELTNGGTLRQPLYAAYRFIVRYVAPIAIAVIFLSELGAF